MSFSVQSAERAAVRFIWKAVGWSAFTILLVVYVVIK
jgi:hypothetical protein